MILTLLSHVTAVRILLVIGIAFIALPIFFYKLSKSDNRLLRHIRNWSVFAGIIMCLPMIYFIYADIRYDLAKFSVNDKLYLAAENKNLGAAEKFLQDGANPCGATRYGKAPVVRAVEQDDEQMLELFLNAGIDVNYCGDGSVTLLGIASGNLCDDTVWMLLQAGADPDYMPGKCIPALHMAASNDKNYNAAIVEMLCNAGAARDSHTFREGKVMLPYRYYYDTHKADEDTITDEEEQRFQAIKDMLYEPYIEWLNDKMISENEAAKSRE